MLYLVHEMLIGVGEFEIDKEAAALPIDRFENATLIVFPAVVFCFLVGYRHLQTILTICNQQ
ncbi:MAG TPA: hypothetical protein PKA00_16335 [Saprospiraceae bacterium]|nr:hypothetical protein [Saprospiraceae bacterium]HMQ84484.1 hypothetical protein [Saprospiraceae bacterium]